MFGSLKNKLSQKFHDMERKLILILYNLKAFQKEVSVNVYKYVEWEQCNLTGKQPFDGTKTIIYRYANCGLTIIVPSCRVKSNYLDIQIVIKWEK